MQLNPSTGLHNQLKGVGGKKLEVLASAVFASIGYGVFRNLIIEFGGKQAAEIDIYASLFTPFRETKTIVDCKGGDPTPKELREFASLSVLIDEPPDSLLFICKHDQPDATVALAKRLNVELLERVNLTYIALPILQSEGSSTKKERIRKLNTYIAWQVIYDYLLTYTSKQPLLRSYRRFLLTCLWMPREPIDQVKKSFDAHQNKFKDVTQRIAKLHATSANKAVIYASNDEIESAMLLELIHRVLNIYAICRLTIRCVNKHSPEYLLNEERILPKVRQTIASLSLHPLYFGRFVPFIQNFLFRWGGFIYVPEEQFELEHMSNDVGVPVNIGQLFLDTIDNLFNSGRSLFITKNTNAPSVKFFAYVPGAFRGLGILHRKALNSSRYSSASFFKHENNYINALDRALSTEIGSHKNLVI
ncbi:hypothetical protein [Meiothermus sp.]|uniref:hypothetical protein n=1 Tax=Meiothermus sp. TaxID=1955249 RepID=UPI002630050A|nr:hypothetical protein [Meiothermus sp.]